MLLLDVPCLTCDHAPPGCSQVFPPQVLIASGYINYSEAGGVKDLGKRLGCPSCWQKEMLRNVIDNASYVFCEVGYSHNCVEVQARSDIERSPNSRKIPYILPARGNLFATVMGVFPGNDTGRSAPFQHDSQV